MVLLFKKWRLVITVLIASLLHVPVASSLGPIDGEIIVSLWNNQFESDLLNGEVDLGSVTASGEIWIGDNWGIRAARYENDLEETPLQNQSRFQLEIRKRILSVSDNNFLALGLGIEQLDLINGESSDGLRLSAEGRLAITPVTYFYGRGALSGLMDDAGGFQDLTSQEIELGVSFTPFPFVSFKVGYLTLDLDYDNASTGASENTRSDGFLIGAGLHW